jgi:hypothetical protein
MFDPKTNRVPYGLLTEEEREVLCTWPHGWEYYTCSEWKLTHASKGYFGSGEIYRGKPAPPIITSTWTNVYKEEVCALKHFSRKICDESRASRFTLVAVLRIDTENGISSAHLEAV